MQIQLSSLRSLLYKTMDGGLLFPAESLYKAVFRASRARELEQATAGSRRQRALRAGAAWTLAHLEMGKGPLNISSRQKEANVSLRDPFYF